MTHTDTPRTDAEWMHARYFGKGAAVVSASFARQLERELADSDARHRADSLALAADRAELRAALADCAEQLRANGIGVKDAQNPKPYTPAGRVFKTARDVLARVQP